MAADQIADSVMLLERGNDGKFALRDTISLEALRNNIPVFGDRIALLIDQGGMSIVEVVERYFLEYIEEERVETAETLDRENRDPAYWTFERKEILRKEREARLAAIRAEEEAAKKR